MSTGACGIDCDVCRLHRDGACSSCGAGRSRDAERKQAAQERLLGAPCPILACARLKGVDHCLCGCEMFPCENFSGGPYPFSQGFLRMQQRRRGDKSNASQTSDSDKITVPTEHWEELGRSAPASMALTAGAVYDPSDGLVITCLNEDVRIDIERRRIQRRRKDVWRDAQNSLLELMVLTYLLNAGAEGLSGELVGISDLSSAHFFQGPHALKTDGLLQRYGNDPDAFIDAGIRLGGCPVDRGGDAAIRLMALPKVPLYFLLWAADEEFPADVSVLFDSSIECHLMADAIWGLVTYASDALLSIS